MLAIRTTRSTVQRLSRRNVSTHAVHGAHPHEGFGKGFYLSIAAVVGTLALYKLDSSSNPEGDAFITRMIAKYHSRKEVWEARNSLRTSMIEQAVVDKNLFDNSPRRTTVPVRYPEALNMGSPWNQVAGFSTRNNSLAAVRKHMETERGRQATALALAK